MQKNWYGDSTATTVPLYVNTGAELAGVPAVRQSTASPITLNNRIIAATKTPQIKIFSLTDSNNDNYGDLETVWNLPAQVTAPLTVTRWIMTGLQDGIIHFYNSDGSESNQPALISQNAITGIASKEIPANNDVAYVVTSSGELYFFISMVMSPPTVPYRCTFPYQTFMPLITDFTNDNIPDMFALGTKGMLLFGRDAIPEYLNLSVSFTLPPAAGDIDGDGIREIITVTGNALYAFNHKGVYKTGFPVNLHSLGYSGTITTELILGDITGDGKQEILFGTNDGNIYALDNRGHIIEGFPLPMGSSAMGSLTFTKGIADGNLEIAGIDSMGYLYLWNLETPFAGKTIAWGQYGANTAHTRSNQETLQPLSTPPADVLMPKDRVYNWPNPNTGNWTKIRYFLYHPASVTIRIFTQTGDKVAEFNAPGISGIDNEVTWNLDGINSGIYFAEISATGSGRTDKKIIKIAVIK
jgi:hypothetical protein